MHLKNFSLLHAGDGSVALAPAYDLVATKLVLPEDEEEMALTVNGKKKNLRAGDFRVLAQSLEISETVSKNTMNEFTEIIPAVLEFVDKSFLNEKMKNEFRFLLQARSDRLGFASGK